MTLGSLLVVITFSHITLRENLWNMAHNTQVITTLGGGLCVQVAERCSTDILPILSHHGNTAFGLDLIHTAVFNMKIYGSEHTGIS